MKRIIRAPQVHREGNNDVIKNFLHSLASLKAIALNVLALLFVLSAYSVIAAEDKFSFDTPAQRESFLKLTAELRCLCVKTRILLIATP